MNNHGWAALTAVTAAAAAMITKALLETDPKMNTAVKVPTQYDEGMEALRPLLWADEWARLKRADWLFEKFFDNCIHDLVKMRRVSVLMDKAVCLSRDIDLVEVELLKAVKDVAGMPMNQRAGRAATVELCSILRKALRRHSNRGVVLATSVGR